MEQQIDAINQYIEISTSELDTLNNNSRCGIVSRINNLIQISRNKIESLEELKTKVHNTNLIWNRDDPLPGQLRTKKNDISCKRNSISLLYSGSSRHMITLSDILNLHQEVVTVSPINNGNINDEFLISEKKSSFSRIKINFIKFLLFFTFSMK